MHTKLNFWLFLGLENYEIERNNNNERKNTHTENWNAPSSRNSLIPWGKAELTFINIQMATKITLRIWTVFPINSYIRISRGRWLGQANSVSQCSILSIKFIGVRAEKVASCMNYVRQICCCCLLKTKPKMIFFLSIQGNKCEMFIYLCWLFHAATSSPSIFLFLWSRVFFPVDYPSFGKVVS